MTELEFGQRLRAARKAKNMTQQELADLLNVSNKSVSRWESGSYPDVPLLAPLAKALGTTVDDLLGAAPPLRTLRQADWQNLLSFAFSIGGGILFFLLNLFTPALICYLIYLGSMAYGVHLQRHYTYHTKWFHRATLVMNFFVNLEFLTSPLSYSAAGTLLSGASAYFTAILNGALAVPVILFLLLWLLLAAGMTAVTRAIIQKGAASLKPPRLCFRRSAFSVVKAIPALCPVLLLGYCCIFFARTPLPKTLYQGQNTFFFLLLAVLTVLTAIYLLLVKQHRMLFPAGGMLAACSLLPLTLTRWVWSTHSGLLLKATLHPPASYVRFGRPGWITFSLTALLAALYLLCCFVQRKKVSIDP